MYAVCRLDNAKLAIGNILHILCPLEHKKLGGLMHSVHTGHTSSRGRTQAFRGNTQPLSSGSTNYVRFTGYTHVHINSPQHTPLTSTLKIAAAYSAASVYALSTVLGFRTGKGTISIKHLLINITLILL
jgi:hypothetical protein